LKLVAFDMARIVGVRFKQAGKIFYYDAADLEMEVNAYVVVDSAHGLAVGRVVISPDQVIANESSSSGEPPKPVLRLATQEDIERDEAMKRKAEEDLRRAKSMVSEQDLAMNIASAEYDLDGSQFTAYFTATERVDFRNLVRDLSRETGARVQLLQVGDRDRAKLTDGVDICGERLCCSSWMTNFPSVSIRMAKEQDLPLNPQKISGVCGRLYCCLTFEYDDYKNLRGTLPKVGAMLSTPAGEARVTGIDFNREVVKLWLTEAHQQVEVAAIDFQLQHGVTVRPMDLVLKIEGPLRPITEASEATLGTSRPPREPREQQPRRDRRARTPRDVSAPAQPQAQRPSAPPPSAPPPGAAAPTPGTDAEGEVQRRRRRRRRRGRGRGPGGAEGGAPAEPTGD
jgi:cell fate regulator YaaT (PSP1 superfamily)